MRYESLENVKLNNCAVTLGKFDGLHAGHMQLINAIVGVSKAVADPAYRLTTVVINLIKENEDRFILSDKEKHELLAAAGVDVCIDVVMTKEFMSYDAMDFLKGVLVDRLGIKYLAVGYDFCYGNGRKGDVEFLKEHQFEMGYKLYVATKESRYGKRVSSTTIKEMLATGEMGMASRCLGRPFSVEGEVVHGNHLGRTLDMPTANIIWPKDKVMVAKGVYLSKVEIDAREYFGITNVGTKPTVEWIYGTNVETNIFDFDEDIYGLDLELSFISRIREEVRFASLEELRIQLEKDRDACMKVVRSH